MDQALGIEYYSRYIRFARSFDGSPYYLAAIHYDGCPRVPRFRLTGDAVDVTSAGGSEGGLSVRAIREGRSYGTSGPGITGVPYSGTVTMVVPDGVATVTIRYPAGPANGFKPKVISPPVTIRATAVGNLLIFNVPRSSGGGQIVQPTSMVWRNNAGAVVRRFRGRL